MAKNQALHTLAEEDILWKDRKRILGLPLSFTTYEVDGSRLTTRQGLLSTTTDEMLLYRILDLQMKQTLGQKRAAWAPLCFTPPTRAPKPPS